MNIPFLRLQHQHLLQAKTDSPTELLKWMGPIQAQDFSMAKLALGLRLNDTTEADLDRQFNEGKFLRTHLMRPTWHFVAAEDIHWLLDLTGHRIISGTRHRREQLGIDDTSLKKALRLLEKELEGNHHLTREAVSRLLEQHHLPCESQVTYHILFYAELEKLVCSGALQNNKQTFALLDERVPQKKTLSKEEALTELGYRYISTRGPVTVEDFVWWSGLNLGDARKAFGANDYRCQTVNYQGKQYWLPDVGASVQSVPSMLLPAYDEFLICYRFREACISPLISPDVISKNGVFRPIMVANGQVQGIWSRKKSGTKIKMELSPANGIADVDYTPAIQKIRQFWQKEVVF